MPSTKVTSSKQALLASSCPDFYQYKLPWPLACPGLGIYVGPCTRLLSNYVTVITFCSRHITILLILHKVNLIGITASEQIFNAFGERLPNHSYITVILCPTPSVSIVSKMWCCTWDLACNRDLAYVRTNYLDPSLYPRLGVYAGLQLPLFMNNMKMTHWPSLTANFFNYAISNWNIMQLYYNK